MATAKASKPVAKIPLEIRIEATTMAIREEIMNYFKGTCVEHMVDKTGLDWHGLTFGRQDYQYQRIDLDRQQHRALFLQRLPLLTFRKLPDTITVNTQVMELSKGLQQVDKELRKFLKDYLVAVAVVTNDTNKLPNGSRFGLDKVEDEKLFTAVPRSGKTAEEEYLEQMLRMDGPTYQMAYDSSYVNNMWTTTTPF